MIRPVFFFLSGLLQQHFELGLQSFLVEQWTEQTKSVYDFWICLSSTRSLHTYFTKRTYLHQLNIQSFKLSTFSLHTYLSVFCNPEHVCCVQLSYLKKERDRHKAGRCWKKIEEEEREREGGEGFAVIQAWGMCQLAVNYVLLCQETAVHWKHVKLPFSHLRLVPPSFLQLPLLPPLPHTHTHSGSSSQASASAAVTRTIAFLSL